MKSRASELSDLPGLPAPTVLLARAVAAWLTTEGVWKMFSLSIEEEKVLSLSRVVVNSGTGGIACEEARWVCL